MFFRQVYDDGLAQASYFIGDETSGESLVVDPRRDVDVYLRLASRNGLKITKAAETHIHADYLSGGRELAATAGAPLCVSGEGEVEGGYLREQPGIDVRLVRNGDDIAVGRVRARVRYTPGHTPEDICFEIFDANQSPMMLLSGDFLFVGDVGRPDLLEVALEQAGTAEVGAHALFHSLRSAVRDLPEYIAIWPGHGSGSACGKALGAIPSTTLGYERRFSWWSGFVERDDLRGFTRALLEGQPDAPSYFARMKHDNRGFTKLLNGLPQPPQLDAATLRNELAEGAVLIDTRSRAAFCKRHIKGALSLPDEPSFSVRAPWFVTPRQRIVLLARPARVSQLVRKLVRVGLDTIVGFIPDIPTSIKVESLAHVNPAQARQLWSSDRALLVDVRQRSEFASGHIPHALHVSAGKLLAQLDAIPRDRSLVITCAVGERSVTAASVLRAQGYPDVVTLEGGFTEWATLGFPTELDSTISTSA